MLLNPDKASPKREHLNRLLSPQASPSKGSSQWVQNLHRSKGGHLQSWHLEPRERVDRPESGGLGMRNPKR